MPLVQDKSGDHAKIAAFWTAFGVVFYVGCIGALTVGAAKFSRKH